MTVSGSPPSVKMSQTGTTSLLPSYLPLAHANGTCNILVYIPATLNENSRNLNMHLVDEEQKSDLFDSKQISTLLYGGV